MDRGAEGRTDRPYFIGPFQVPSGVQKEKKKDNYSKIKRTVSVS